MTHDELRDLSGGYALGTLSEAERRAFEAHLPTCPECAEEVRGFAAVASGLALRPCRRSIRQSALRDRVLRAATATIARRRGPTAPRSLRRALVFLSAAAALVALALGLYAASLHQRIRVLEEELRLRLGARRDVAAAARPVSGRVGPRARRCARFSRRRDLRRIDLAGQKGRARRVRPRVLESGAGSRRRVRQSAGDVIRIASTSSGSSRRTGCGADQRGAAGAAARWPRHRARCARARPRASALSPSRSSPRAACPLRQAT